MTVLTVALIDNVTHGMIICVSLRQPSDVVESRPFIAL